MGKVKSRYGHKKGLTALFVDFKSCSFVSCGNDTDLRIWQDIDDEDITEFTTEEPATSVVCHGDKIYIGSAASGMVKVIDKASGKAEDGCVTRFSLPITHMAISNDGRTLFVSSSEVGVIRNIALETGRFATFGYEHDAPVISLALDPREEFIASASGDGSVRIWNIFDTECLHTMPNLLMKTNDISTDRPLARLCWEPKDGQFLAIPARDGVQLYERQNGWKLHKTLVPRRSTGSANENSNGKHQEEQQDVWFSVCAYSHCGKYIAAGSLHGMICVWNATTGELLARKWFPKKAHICAIGWDPVREDEVIYCDVASEVGALKELQLAAPAADQNQNGKISRADGKRKLAKIMIEDDDDEEERTAGGNGILFKDNSAGNKPAQAQKQRLIKRSNTVMSDEDPGLENDDDDIGALKRFYNTQIGLDEFGNTTERPVSPAAHNEIDIDHLSNQAPMETFPVVTSAAGSWYPNPAQQSFVVGSMPEEVEERCMKWNADGLVKHYNNHGDNTIEVQYHDASVHHQFTLDNSGPKFTLADITLDAVAFASCGQAQKEKAEKSQLRVMHLKAWDTAAKEWNVDMPEGECIQALCLGSDWVAVATDQRIVRIFTITGIQRFMFTISGPVVAICGSSSRLAIVYHNGVGLDGDQCLAFIVFKVNWGNMKCIDLQPRPELDGRLAISPKSTLTWLGFLPSGALVCADSNGIVRVMNRAVQSTWLPICDTKVALKSKSETAWIVSVFEKPSRQIRYILCKNDAKYPSFNRGRPIVQVMNWSVPVCDMGNQKMPLESTLILNDFEKGYNDMLFGDDDLKKVEIEAVVKLFAISCNTERDCRSLDIARLMPTSEAMQILIRHAVAQKRHVLAQKIGELALQKAQELEMDQYRESEPRRRYLGTSDYRMDEAEEERLLKLVDGGCGNLDKRKSSDSKMIKLKRKSVKEREQQLAEFGCAQPTGSSIGSILPVRESPIIDSDSKNGDEVTKASNTPSSGQRLNPFKKVRPTTPTPQLLPGVSAFDDPSFAIKDGNKKRGLGFGDAPTALSDGDGKKTKAEKKTKQATLDAFSATTVKNRCNNGIDKASVESNQESASTKPNKSLSGFDLYMQENGDYLTVTMPDDDAPNAYVKHAANCFRQLTDDERRNFVDRAKQIAAKESEGQMESAVSVSID